MRHEIMWYDNPPLADILHRYGLGSTLHRHTCVNVLRANHLHTHLWIVRGTCPTPLQAIHNSLVQQAQNKAIQEQ